MPGIYSPTSYCWNKTAAFEKILASWPNCRQQLDDYILELGHYIDHDNMTY